VVGTDDPFVIVKTKRQRHAAMRADITGDHHLTFHAINHQLLIKQRGLHRRGANVTGAGDRVPAFASRNQSSGSKVQWAGGVGSTVFMVILPAHRKAIV
jgi:hypothetical protein